jgi:3-oxoacyl-[acyl-carrier protein] reductase
MMPPNWGQEGRVAVITGATGYLGRAISRAFVDEGAIVVLSARDQRSLEGLASELRGESRRVHIVPVDLAETGAGEPLIRAAVGFAGKIDTLILNAGVLDDALVAGLSDERLSKVHALNVLGSFRVLQAVLRPMLLQRSGSIVAVSSTAAQRPGVGQAAYASSKAALEALVRTTARETADRGIRVNAVAPGLLAGGMAGRILDEASDSARGVIPMKRPGDAAEIVPVILFLASPMSSYITGQVWAVDGGFTA